MYIHSCNLPHYRQENSFNNRISEAVLQAPIQGSCKTHSPKNVVGGKRKKKRLRGRDGGILRGKGDGRGTVGKGAERKGEKEYKLKTQRFDG